MNHQSSNPSRREFVKVTAGGLVAISLAGCCNVIPSIATPIFFGFKDYGTADGAPVPLRVFFPSLQGVPQTAEMYTDCGKYPLIIFLHGDGTTHETWFQMPAQLARAGFVVAVFGGPDIIGSADGAIDQPKAVLRWIRQKRSKYNGHLASKIGVAGHSIGATQALALAIDIGADAFAGLSGVWSQGFPNGLPFKNVQCPILIQQGQDETQYSPQQEALNPWNLSSSQGKEWQILPRPKHLIEYKLGQHFDYVPINTAGLVQAGPRSSCNLIPEISADFMTSFFSKYMGPDISTAPNIPESLICSFTRTADQEIFAGGFMPGFAHFANNQKDETCSTVSYWETNYAANPQGEVHLGF